MKSVGQGCFQRSWGLPARGCAALAVVVAGFLLGGCREPGSEEDQAAGQSNPEVREDRSPLPEWRGTCLHLDFADAEGARVIPSKVELLLVAWGNTERLPLQAAGGRALLPLDIAWLHEQWRPSRGSFHWAYIYLESPGYASIRSERFFWPGARNEENEVVEITGIRFPCGAEARISEGEQVECTVTFREPQSRRLKLVDPVGTPVSGVEVASYMFWSHNNHCGVLMGADPLGSALSDELGRVTLLDGAFEYAFQFRKPGWLLNDQQSWDPMRLLTSLGDEETKVVLRKKERRALRLLVKRGDAPARGCTLYAALAHAGCGANWGALATADEQGRIALRDFCPESYELVFFLDEKEQRVWTADPRKPRFADLVVVDLASTR